jgi:hypothetical protein
VLVHKIIARAAHPHALRRPEHVTHYDSFQANSVDTEEDGPALKKSVLYPELNRVCATLRSAPYKWTRIAFVRQR